MYPSDTKPSTLLLGRGRSALRLILRRCREDLSFTNSRSCSEYAVYSKQFWGMACTIHSITDLKKKNSPRCRSTPDRLAEGAVRTARGGTCTHCSMVTILPRARFYIDLEGEVLLKVARLLTTPDIFFPHDGDHCFHSKMRRAHPLGRKWAARHRAM